MGFAFIFGVLFENTTKSLLFYEKTHKLNKLNCIMNCTEPLRLKLWRESRCIKSQQYR